MLAAVGAAAAAQALVAVVTAWRVPGLSATSDSALATALMVGAGLGLVTVGLEHVRRGRRRHAGVLLIAAGMLWLMSESANPAIGSATAFTVGLVFGWLAPAVVAHALLAFRAERLGRVDVVLVALAYSAFGVGLGLVPALTFDAAGNGCAFCPPDLVAIAPSAAVSAAALRLGAAAGAFVSIAVGARLMTALRAEPSAARRLHAPMLIAGASFALLVAIELGRAAIVGAAAGGGGHVLRLTEAALLIAVAAGASLEWIRVRRSRTLVARIVTELGHSPPVGGLRDALASILRDPGLRLAYPLLDGTRVDAAGQTLDVGDRTPRDRTITPILRDGEVVAILDHRSDVLQAPEVVDEMIRAARLGLEHERLQAMARAQLASLSAARKRIVAAAAAERQRLERDLHDGAQQRLIAIALNLRVLAADVPHADEGSEALIAEASGEIARAVDELREVAHGLYPSVLVDEGLAAAIEGLAEASSVPVRLHDVAVDPLETPIAEAAYAVAAEAVELGNGPVDIRATRNGGSLTVVVQGPDVPDHVLVDLGDRIGAVDGILTATHPRPGRSELVVEIPCAS